MGGTRKIDRDAVAAEPWGDAYLRELDLVVAANVFASMASGETLYEDDLCLRVGAYCSPLDGGLVDDFLGVVDVPAVNAAGDEYLRVPEALGCLRGKPRGTWAVLRKDGKCDAFMSDGHGGVGTRSGHKFQYTKATAPDFSHARLYAAVLSMLVHTRRKEMEAEIVGWSFERSGVAPGTVAKNVRMMGKTFTKVEFPGPAERADMTLVRGTRPGVKTQSFLLTKAGFCDVFGVPMLLPDRYQDPANGIRLRTMRERRVEAAKAVLAECVVGGAIPGLTERGKYYWNEAGPDVYRCPAYFAGDEPGSPAGEFAVTFSAGSNIVLGSEMVGGRVPAHA